MSAGRYQTKSRLTSPAGTGKRQSMGQTRPQRYKKCSESKHSHHMCRQCSMTYRCSAHANPGGSQRARRSLRCKVNRPGLLSTEQDISGPVTVASKGRKKT